MSESPYDFVAQGQDGVELRDWAAIYRLDNAPGDETKLEDLLPASDLDIEYRYDGVLVTVYGKERLTLAEVKAPSVAQAVAHMPGFVKDSLRGLLGL